MKSEFKGLGFVSMVNYFAGNYFVFPLMAKLKLFNILVFLKTFLHVKSVNRLKAAVSNAFDHVQFYCMDSKSSLGLYELNKVIL